MRTGLLLAIVLAAVAGCQKKAQGPKTTSIEPPMRTAEQLQPLPDPQPGDYSTYSQPAPPTYSSSTYAPPAAIAAPGSSVPAVRTYTVQRGDTGFMGIARRELGDAGRWREIRDLNPGVDTTDLKVGQRLRIPAN